MNASDNAAMRGILRDETGLMHADLDGAPACGYDGDVVDTIYPFDRTGIWCTACAQAVIALRAAGGVRG